MKIEQEELLNFERNREERVSCKSNSREFNCPGLRGLRYNILARKHFWDIFNIIVQHRDTEVPISRCAAVCSWTQWPFDLPTIRTLRTHTRNCFMCVLSTWLLFIQSKQIRALLPAWVAVVCQKKKVNTEFIGLGWCAVSAIHTCWHWNYNCKHLVTVTGKSIPWNYAWVSSVC